MKHNKNKWILIGIVLAGFVGIGFYWIYGQASNLVAQEIEAAKARVEGQGDGSVLEWDQFSIEGATAMMSNFHYYNARENYEIFADQLSMSKRFGENYSDSFEGLVIQFGEYDQYEVESGILENFNTAEDLSDFVSEKTVFNGFRWVVNDPSGFVLTTDRIEIDDLDHLKAKRLFMDNVNAHFEAQSTVISSPRVQIDDLLLLSSNEKYFQLEGVLYSRFLMEDILGKWHGEDVLTGSFDSQGKLVKGEYIYEEASLDAHFELDVDAQFFKENALSDPDIHTNTLAFFESLELDHYHGELSMDAEITEGTDMSLLGGIFLEDLANMNFGANFTGYSPQLFRDLDDYEFGEEIPESFDQLYLENAQIQYEDVILADQIISEYVNIDPALISFFAQMSLPQFFPQDPALIRDFANGISVFLYSKNQFAIIIEPPMPVSLGEILNLVAEKGPYQAPLGIEIIGE